MRKITYIITLISLSILTACTKEDSSIEYDETDVAVVEAYLEQGRAISVKLSKMLPFTEGGNTEHLSIDSANVYIQHNGVDYLLIPDPEHAGIHSYLEPDLEVVPNESYKLFFEYNGYTVSAITTIPAKPNSPSINTGIFYVDPNAMGPGTSTQDPLIVSWNNPNNIYHLIVVEYLDSSYDPIFEINSDSYSQYRKVSSEPILDQSFNLTTRQHLKFFGNYRVIIYTINKEYVNLYENISQSTLNLSEPLTNIENGLGIFTGINSDTLLLKVKSL